MFVQTRAMILLFRYFEEEKKNGDNQHIPSSSVSGSGPTGGTFPNGANSEAVC